MEAVTLYVTWPDMERAEAAARALVEQRLVACANLLPGAVSIYRWQDTIERENEVVMIAKTLETHASAARDAIVLLHPYVAPCVEVWPVRSTQSHEPFMEWIAQNVG